MRFDVIVVGAGPAGSVAATVAGRHGLRVLLLDRAKFPRDKVCGDAISGKCLSAMRRVGITTDLSSLGGNGVTGITFGAPSGKSVTVEMKSSRSKEFPGYVCRRLHFDAHLFHAAADSGAVVIENCSVHGLSRAEDGFCRVQVKLPGNEESFFESPIVIGADGANSAIARSLGFKHHDRKHFAAGLRVYYENVRFDTNPSFPEIHFVEQATPGYFWIFPLGDGRANVGIGMLNHVLAKRGGRLKVVFEDCIRHRHFRERFADAVRVGEFKGWGLPFGSSSKTMAGPGWMLAGDAASLIDPFTGEGIGNAMISGEEAARAAIRAHEIGDFSESGLKAYEAAVSARLRRELRLSHTLQRLAYSPRLLNFVIGRAGGSAEIGEILSGMFSDLQVRRKLISPAFYLRLLGIRP